MKRCLSIAGPVGLRLAVTIGLALIAGSAPAETTLYELTAESSYLEGCYEPCRCLLMQNQTLRGVFLLGDASGTDEESAFDILDIAWQYRQDDESIPVTGSGIYRVAADQQRLTLDLVVGDSPEQQFDSGWVPRQATAPELSVAVALNGFYCYDFVFDVTARPSPVPVLPMTWGGLKGVYR